MDEPLLDDQRRKEVLRQCLSVGVATGTYGISFGALSVAAGLNLWQTIALSALLFSGASQFAVVGIVAAGGSGAAAVATSTLLGMRNGLYGLQMSRLLGASRRQSVWSSLNDQRSASDSGAPDSRCS
jgi:predicted branched-subunit amino acid permease